MVISRETRFSQFMLEDYLACRRRFLYRHVKHLEWPPLETDQMIEQQRRMSLGSRFHQMVEQHVSRIPDQRLSELEMNDDLREWWEAYLHANPVKDPKAVVTAEKVLSASLAGFRILAKYDLIASFPDGKLQIWDWKTAANKPKRHHLARHTQTRLYRYLAVKAGASLHRGDPVLPEQVEMIYWFANFPDQAQHFPYDVAQHQADEEYLADLITQIAAHQDEDEFISTGEERACRYCVYRSLCGRGTAGGNVDEFDVDQAEDVVTGAPLFDLDAIAEIAL